MYWCVFKWLVYKRLGGSPTQPLMCICNEKERKKNLIQVCLHIQKYVQISWLLDQELICHILVLIMLWPLSSKSPRPRHLKSDWDEIRQHCCSDDMIYDMIWFRWYDSFDTMSLSTFRPCCCLLRWHLSPLKPLMQSPLPLISIPPLSSPFYSLPSSSITFPSVDLSTLPSLFPSCKSSYRGSGGSSPSGVRGRAPAADAFWHIYGSQNAPCGSIFQLSPQHFLWPKMRHFPIGLDTSGLVSAYAASAWRPLHPPSAAYVPAAR